MKTLVAAQIGCGKFAWSQDLRNMTGRQDVRLKWVCDLNLEHARNTAEHFGIEKYTDNFMDIVNDPEVDFIKIATSHEAHVPIIEAAAKMGKHIFCEKPMAMTEADSYKIMRAVHRSGIKFCVDLNRRMSPSLVALRKRWLEHKANPVHSSWKYVETQRELMPEENRPHLLIRIQDESSSYGMVHMDPVMGGGEILAESVHWLDLACWFFAPQLPCEITAWGSSRLSHGINLLFDGGASMTLDFTCSGTFDYPKELFELTHNAALFRSLFFVENNYYGIPGAEPEYFKLQSDPYPEMGPGMAGYMEKYSESVKGLSNAKYTGDKVPLIVDKGHLAMLNGFMDSIRNNTSTPCDEMAGFRSTYLACKAIESIELKRSLYIPIEKITPCFV